MIAAWTLIVLTCTGPGATGDCRAQTVATYATRWDCRQVAIAREMAGEQTRAWCQKEVG